MRLKAKFLIVAFFILPILTACHSEEEIKTAIDRCWIDNFGKGISSDVRDCKDSKNYEQFFK